MKIDLNEIYMKASQDGVDHLMSAVSGSVYIPSAMKRTEWTGEGLPPVETVCEVLYNSDPEEFVTCKVIGYDENDVVIRITSGKRTGQYERVPPAWTGRTVFRPIPTPEQIAAEEREKAKMVRLAWVRDTLFECGHLHPSFELSQLAGSMYDKGYRKQVAP